MFFYCLTKYSYNNLFSVYIDFSFQESQFYLYAMYNKNKPKSDSLMAEYGNNFFKVISFLPSDFIPIF